MDLKPLESAIGPLSEMTVASSGGFAWIQPVE